MQRGTRRILKGVSHCVAHHRRGVRRRALAQHVALFILKLPARLITAGQALALAVRMKPGGRAWVMVHGYDDPFAAALPEPATDAIAAFTPHAGGKQGVTIGEFAVELRRK